MNPKACPYTMQIIGKKNVITGKDETSVAYGPCLGPQCALFVAEQDDQGQPVKDPKGNVIGGCAHVIAAIAAARSAEFLTEPGDDEPDDNVTPLKQN